MDPLNPLLARLDDDEAKLKAQIFQAQGALHYIGLLRKVLAEQQAQTPAPKENGAPVPLADE
jgi:hypothetical protein